MKLPIVIATLLLAVGTALPVFAATPAPISASLRDAAAAPLETVEYRARAQGQRQYQGQRTSRSYRSGFNSYAAQPRVRRQYQQGGNWGHCVQGLDRGSRSAFPNWDLC